MVSHLSASRDRAVGHVCKFLQQCYNSSGSLAAESTRSVRQQQQTRTSRVSRMIAVVISAVWLSYSSVLLPLFVSVYLGVNRRFSEHFLHTISKNVFFAALLKMFWQSARNMSEELQQTTLALTNQVLLLSDICEKHVFAFYNNFFQREQANSRWRPDVS